MSVTPSMAKTPTERQLRIWHAQWLHGTRDKNEIERQELSDPRSHGKRITRLWRSIGIETEGTHPLVLENRRLRAALNQCTKNAEKAAAVDWHNDPARTLR